MNIELNYTDKPFFISVRSHLYLIYYEIVSIVLELGDQWNKLFQREWLCEIYSKWDFENLQIKFLWFVI